MSDKEAVANFMKKQRYPKIKHSIYIEESKITLEKLNIPKESQFYEFYSTFFVFLLDKREYTHELAECCQPTNYLPSSIQFGYDAWGLPQNYLLFTTGESEAGYLYNQEDGTVWNFELGDQKLLGTDQLRHWNSFYEFLIWYLAIDEDEN